MALLLGEYVTCVPALYFVIHSGTASALNTLYHVGGTKVGACAQGIPYYDSTGNGSFSVNATLLSATSQLKYVSGRAAAALLQVIHIFGCVCCCECHALCIGVWNRMPPSARLPHCRCALGNPAVCSKL